MEVLAGMTTNNVTNSLLELYEKCSQESYDTIMNYIEELEEEIELLEVEIESMNGKPRRRRPKEEDWK